MRSLKGLYKDVRSPRRGLHDGNSAKEAAGKAYDTLKQCDRGWRLGRGLLPLSALRDLLASPRVGSAPAVSSVQLQPVQRPRSAPERLPSGPHKLFFSIATDIVVVVDRYHGWLTSKAVGTIMTAAPKREKILETMGIMNEAQGKEAVGPFLTLIEPIVADIIAMMDELGCNFPDKV